MIRNRLFPAPAGLPACAARAPLLESRAWRLDFEPEARIVARWHIRWGRVRALRAAIASGGYDLEARIHDLLDDPPADWVAGN